MQETEEETSPAEQPQEETADTFAPNEAPPAEAPSESTGDPVNDSALEELVGIDRYREQAMKAVDWLRSQMLTIDVAIEAVVLFAALLPAAIFGPKLKKIIREQVAPRAPFGVLRRAANAFAHIATPIALFIILQTAVIRPRFFRGDVEPQLYRGGSQPFDGVDCYSVSSRSLSVRRSGRVSHFTLHGRLRRSTRLAILDDVVNQVKRFFAIPHSTTDSNGRPANIVGPRRYSNGLLIFGVAVLDGASVAGKFIKGRISAIDELTVSFKALLSKILDILVARSLRW